jgi:arsenical pump membrane protein
VENVEELRMSLTILTFSITLFLILWRPKQLNEAIPAFFGAILVILIGSVTYSDLIVIVETVGGAAITIIATIVMANVLESFGFFRWTAEYITAKARGSGIRLFWYVNLLCFLMTLFFNNDGSILITTPIIILLLKNLQLTTPQKIPYLLSGAMIATASSAPIGVSNIVNLIALKIVGMDLYIYTAMMFVPVTIGLLLMLLLFILVFKNQIPKKIYVMDVDLMSKSTSGMAHPLKKKVTKNYKKQTKFMLYIFIFVFAVRCGLFVASYLHFPIEVVAVLGSIVLLGWRWYNLKISPKDIVSKTPWHILIFALGMYIIIYGLNNIGLSEILISLFSPIVNSNLLQASLVMGGLMSVLSSLFNNHPALMIGTLTLSNMNLDPLTLKVTYLATVIGSDIGALLLPIGTLATLIWLHILKEAKIKISWKYYVKVSFLVIPPTLIFSLVSLYYWITLLFG